jgi:putative Holliday junction resolvase
MTSDSAVKTYLALDIGLQRIGVAIAQSDSRLPKPLDVIFNNDNFIDQLEQLIQINNVNELIIGIPHGLDGQSTEQTRYTEEFVPTLKKSINLPIYKQDEAVTSVQAEEELIARGKPYSKGDIDSLAATYILDDFLQQSRIEST